MVETWYEAQASVIGSALIDPAVVPIILADMRDSDFSGAYQNCFVAIRELSAAGAAIDPVTVMDRLGGKEHSDFLRDLMQRVPTTAHVEEYIRIAKEQSMLSRLRDIGETISSATTLKEAREQLAAADQISADSTSAKVTSAGDAVQEWYDRINAGEKVDYITTGIGCIDNTIKTRDGNFVIIAGYPSHGKSAIAIQMAWEMSGKHKVGYFCYETPRDEWIERILSLVSRVRLDAIQDRELSQGEMMKANTACAEIWSRSVCHINAAGMTVDDIRAETLRSGFDVIFVDYLQKVTPQSRKFGRVQEVSDISSGLQQMALNHGITVYGLSQLSRPLKSDKEFIPTPGLSDLRESGQIEQDADAVLIVHAPLRFREEKFRILSIPKNRHGKTKSFYFSFDGEIQRFRAPTDAEAKTYAMLAVPRRGDNRVQMHELENEYRKRKEREKNGNDSSEPVHQETLFSENKTKGD